MAKAEAASTIQQLRKELSESETKAGNLQGKLAELEARVAEAERELEAARIHIRQLEAPSISSSSHAVS
jgi:peptidoglycan hydrolase CwlO-like protein